MAQNFSQQPINLLTQATTMNSADDPSSLKENEASLIENFIKTNGIFEVRQGRAALNSGGGNALPAACFGLSTFDPLDSDTKQYVAITNGAMYAGASFPLASKLTGFTASTLMRLAPFNGKMLVNDPSVGMAWYDGTSAGWCGIPSPKEAVLIDDFESVTGWSTTNGSATLDDTNVIHGRHGIKFKASSGATYSPRKTITSLNLTAFLAAPKGDGASSILKDYIRLQLVRSFMADFTTLDLVVLSSAGNWSYARISDLPEWSQNDGAGVVFDVYLRKSSFQVGAGTLDWSAVTQVGFDIVAASGKTPFIICDWLRMERSGPVAQELGKRIADFEPDETWAGTPSPSFDYKYKSRLSRALILVGSGASAYRDYSPSLDLTTLENGVSADTIDTISIKVARNYLKTAGTLTLSFRDTAGSPVTASYIINADDILTPRIGTANANKLTDPSLVYHLFEIRKDSFTNGGTINWASLDRVTLTSSAHGGSYYIDEVLLTREKDKKTVLAFEPTDTVTVTGAISYGWADPNKDPHASDEGSSTSLKVKIGAKASAGISCTVETAFSPDLDLSAYASGAASQSSDLIGPRLWVSNSKNIAEIDIYYDTDNGAYTSYYIKKLTRAAGQIPDVINGWFPSMRFPIREHEQLPSTGATGTWANVDKCKIVITTVKGTGGVTVYLDQWILTRGTPLAGRYWYAVTFRNPRGARSDLSIISNPVDVSSGNIMLTSIPTTSGCYREMWRIGGAYNIWKLCGIIGDDETTIFEDTLSDTDLGDELPPLYDQPMISKTFCVHDNFVIRANLTELSGGYRHKTMVAVGIEFSIDEIELKSTFEVGKEDGYEILALIPFLDRVFVFKEKGIASFDPYNLDQKPVWYSKEIGILNGFAWAIDPRGILYFISTDKKCYSFNGSSFDETFAYPIRDLFEAIPDSYVGKVVGEYFHNLVLFSIPQLNDTANSKIVVWDTKDASWQVATGWPTSIFHVLAYSGGFSLIGGTENADGLLYTYFSGDTDNGAVIVGIIQTRAIVEDPTITKQPGNLCLLSKKSTATSASLRVEPYYDLTDSTDNIDCTIDDQTHKREDPIGVPSPGYWPTFISFKLTTSLARLAIRSLTFSRREEQRR